MKLGLSEGEALLLFLFRLFTFDHFLDDIKESTKIHGVGHAYVILLDLCVTSQVGHKILYKYSIS